MTTKRHADALDRLDQQATSALDLFFGTAAPVDEGIPVPAESLAPVPPEATEPVLAEASEPATPGASAEPSPRTGRITRRIPPPTPDTALVRAAETPRAPAEGPGPAARTEAPLRTGGAILRPAYLPVATGISALADEQLHQAAYTAGGEREKSRLVREAVAALLAAFDTDPIGRETLRALMRRPPTEGRITRIYRLAPEVRERLTLFARDERIPIAAVLRAAIERRYGSETVLQDESGG